MSDLDELYETLGVTAARRASYAARPRPCGCGRTYGDPVDYRSCVVGYCVECYCPCGVFDGSGWGPVGCPCQVYGPGRTRRLRRRRDDRERYPHPPVKGRPARQASKRGRRTYPSTPARTTT